MKVLVGLGNPGEKYETTRHNLGFLTLDRLLKDCTTVDKSSWREESKLKSHIAEIVIPNVEEKVLLVKPQTFMNSSGLAVKQVSSYYKVSPEDIWVIYDELDLPLGTLKIRFGGAAAGHHGVESIMEHLGTTEFWRFRLGIGESRHKDLDDDGKGDRVGNRKIRNVEDYVISNFSDHDYTEAKKMVKHTSEALQCALEKGLEVAQNRFNTK